MTDQGEPLGPLLLQDMADFRNHRHHGLIGAVVVEYASATPYEVLPGNPTAVADAPVLWHGTRAAVKDEVEPNRSHESIVLLAQDGLRLYLRGHVQWPIPDEPPGAGDDLPDHEDRGQKGFNYRSEPVGAWVGALPSGSGGEGGGSDPQDWLNVPNPATPVWVVPVGELVRFHFVGGFDKPRNQSFTIHGVAWPEHRFLPPGGVSPVVSSESALTCGTVRTFEFTPKYAGDHAYRSGVLKWAVPQGMRGVLRVQECSDAGGTNIGSGSIPPGSTA
jgi:hypothetical protein